MSDFCFEFLYSFDGELLEKCVEMEAYIRNGYYTDSIITARVIGENTIEKIAKMENIDFNESEANNQKDKISLLFKVNIINEPTANSFDNIRVFSNNVAHGVYRSTLESALNVHRNVYNILTFYYSKYGGDDDFHKKPYDYDPFHMRKPINSMINFHMDDSEIEENAFLFEINEIKKMLSEKNGELDSGYKQSINDETDNENEHIEDLIEINSDGNDLIDGNDLMDNKNRGLMDDFKDEGLILDPIDFDSLNKEGIKPADDSDLSKIKSLINKRFRNDK
ncbi:hypothetical protein [uncultured Methanobrevibacter sp.]|uniref:hypothetical protein n=1 Tax=uncultured Methanobrevibacter sp. TaxID=253161 RepID=UPI0025888C6A|nr:hypothetical protein [uncultured Methanobrevibacter sp.]